MSSAKGWTWIEFALATPVVLWCGLPFFVRGRLFHCASQLLKESRASGRQWETGRSIIILYRR